MIFQSNLHSFQAQVIIIWYSNFVWIGELPMDDLFYQSALNFFAYMCCKSCALMPMHHIYSCWIRVCTKLSGCIMIAKTFCHRTSWNMPVLYHQFIRRPEEYLSPTSNLYRVRQRFYSRSCFLATQLEFKFQKMNKWNRVLRGHKDQEYECGNCMNWLPIPYVPVMDEV